LLTRSFMQLLTVNPGFQAAHIMTARFSLPQTRYREDAERRNFVATLLEKLRSIPGVKHSGITTYLPFSSSKNAGPIKIVGRALAPGELPPVPGANTIDSGYLQTMGVPLLAGRNFSDSDGPDSMRVALVDQYLARKYWPDGNAVGS